MIIWSVLKVYENNNQHKYIIMPYSFSGTMEAYLRGGKIKELIRFLRNSRLSGKAAQRVAARLNCKTRRK